MDCGGGTTDLSACRFKVTNEKSAYNIQIETTYENGDPDFGGDNLTFRIMQLLKISLAREILGAGASLHDIVTNMYEDVYSFVEEQGVKAYYNLLDEVYASAESIIPTKFKEHEYELQADFHKIRNNMYFLFTLAEKVKKELFSDAQILQVTVGCTPSWRSVEHSHIYAPPWKLAANIKGKLSTLKEFPQLSLSSALVNTVLSAEIYDIINCFFGRLYESGELDNYEFINLTGQSCKIDVFKRCVKEYVPGKLMRGMREERTEEYHLKLTCIDGVIHYLSDQRLGYANVAMKQGEPSYPYELCGYTHSGVKVTLIEPLNKRRTSGSISRALGSVELRLHLHNARGEEKHIYTIFCEPDTFDKVTYEDIAEIYGPLIPQGDMDIVINGEVCYFIHADAGAWGFSVIPISRDDDQVYLGPKQIFPFESESWIIHYFDGTW